MKKYLKLYEEYCSFISDNIRMDIIKNSLNKSTSKEVNYDLLLSHFWDGGYDDQTYIRKVDDYYVMYEGWVDECWEGAYSKDIYKDLSEEEILEHLCKVRYPEIINKLNMEFINSGYFYHEGYEDGFISYLKFR